MAVNFSAIFKAQENISKAFKSINSSGEKLDAGFNKISASGSKIGETLDRNNAPMDKFTNKMEHVGKAIDKTGNEVDIFKDKAGKLRYENGQTATGLKKTKDGFETVDKSAKKTNKTLGASTGLFNKLKVAAASFLTVATILGTVNAFSSFEKGMYEVFTLLPNISESAMGEMTDQAKAFSKELGVLPEKTIPALYQALSAGVPENNVFDYLETANKAAVGGITSLETAVDGLTTVTNSYGADVIDVNKASDLMFTTVKLGKTNFEELSGSLFNVLPSASAVGVAFEDVSAAIATMTSQGTPTAVATTKLRSAIDELSKSGTKTDKIFRQVAGKGFKDFVAEGGNLQGAMQLLEVEANRTGLGINDLFSSVEAGGAALSLTGKGSETFTKAMEEMANATGATDAAFETMEKTFSRRMEKMKAKLEVLKVEVGGKLAGAFLYVWDKAEPIFGYLVGAITSVKALFDDLGFYGAIDEMFGPKAVSAIQSGVGLFTDTIIPAWQNIFSVLKDNIIIPLIGYLETNIPKMVNIFSNMWAILEPIFGYLVGAFGRVFSVAGSAFGGIIAVSLAFSSSLFTILDGIIQLISGVFTGNWGSAWEGVIQLFKGIWEGIVVIFKAPLNLMIDGFNAFIRGINKVKIPDFIPGIGGKGFSIGEIPKFAKGTKSSPDTFIAGEEGPELITGKSGSRVFPSDDTSQILKALSAKNEPLTIKNNPFNVNNSEEVETTPKNKNITLNINANGKIVGSGVSKHEVLTLLIENLKPILLEMLETEVYEEGELSYVF